MNRSSSFDRDLPGVNAVADRGGRVECSRSLSASGARKTT